ncbi:MAG: hypothetical protein M3Y93_06100 [Pseudomonadota bacterium]|nr:hypothetical protein [Pseudomonadota bacterium]
MGNTNIPQFGAANTTNSRDTRVGTEQLTDDQERQRDAQADGGVSALLPDSVANESQRVIVHVDRDKTVISETADEAVEGTTSEEKAKVVGTQPTETDAQPAGAVIQPAESDYRAVAGHVGTGHSPSDAT